MKSPTARAGVVAALFLVVFATVLLSRRLDPTTAKIVSDLTFVALGLIYVPLAVRAARSSQGRVKAAWSALAVGFASWLLGEVLYAYYQLSADQIPSPSWADAAYLIYYPWVCLALLLFPTARGWRSQAQMVLDAVIVTGSFFLISWLTVMRSVWRNGSADELDFIVSVAYPAGDVLIMTVGLMVVMRAPPGLRRTLTLLVAGLMAAALADSLWVYQSSTTGYSAGSLIDLLYALNALLIIVALVDRSGAGAADVGVVAPPSWLSRTLPLIPLAIAAFFVAPAQPALVMESSVVVTGVVLVVSLVMRQFLEAAELARRERQVRTMADRLKGELTSAGRYVASILPGDLDGPVTVRTLYLPAREIGGDSFGYLWIDDDHLIVYLIDVSGHGVEPALLSVSVHNLLRSRSMPAATLRSPERVMAELNRLFAMEKHGGHYFTIWYGVYEPSTRLLRYAAAGHPPALALTDRDGVVTATPLGGTARPIGMFADSVFTAETCQVLTGAQILLCSDGVLGDLLSFADFTELCEEVAATPGWTPNSLIARLKVTADVTFDDDCALVQLTF